MNQLQNYTLDVAGNLLSLGIIFGPLIGYIAQYNLVKASKNLGSFSIDVCAILIFANILRIFFWFGVHYETPLLIQSCFMIAMQFVLLDECIHVRKIDAYKETTVTIFSAPISAFWRWTNTSSFVIATLLLIFAICLNNITFTKKSAYWELLGFLSCAVEASLGLPQAFRNQRQKSTHGLSYTMIGTWLIGDSFKTVYYVIRAAPFQFVVCGVTQIVVDIWIVAQIALFNKATILEL